ncbi:MAG TPA: CaiB/BaiF CoA-transferase family protein [Candidatus Binataceae bacterium]|nr:CaiB/BaiF CoA-transferase family protein [Candidatus Binataceae bacterium]
MAVRAGNGIMKGIKVLDMTQVIAGPSATHLLAEMGAEVIKIELGPTGDRYRFFIQVNNRGTAFVRLNRGKKSLCMNFRTAEAKRIVREMLPKFDVLVENFAPGVMARMGLDYESVRKINPRIIMCSISAFGQTGPLASQPGFDYLGAAYAGVLDVLGGERDGSPTLAGVAIGDYLTGMTAMAAIGCALFHRAQTGEGQHVEASLLDSYFYTQDQAVVRQALSGGKFIAKRLGRYERALCPQGLFKGEKHWLCILSPMDKMWRQLCVAMDKPELARHPDFATNAKRVTNRTQVFKILQDWLDATPEDEALRRMQENRVPVAPVLNTAEAVAHPHLRQRGTVRKAHDPVLGEVDVPGFPIRFSAGSGPQDTQAPFLGQHNADVLKEFLGFSDDSIAHLKEQGVLMESPIDVTKAQAKAKQA